MEITELTATQILAAQESGELTAVETCEAFLERIESLDGALGAFLSVNRGAALQMAEAVDHRREIEGEPLGALAGIPLSVKDNMCTTGGQQPVPPGCSPNSFRPTMPLWFPA